MDSIKLASPPLRLQQQQQQQRHPTACKNCRRRGRKCDRALPVCAACEGRRVACEGYVTRWPGVAARGRLAGKRVPVVVEEVNDDDDGEALVMMAAGLASPRRVSDDDEGLEAVVARAVAEGEQGIAVLVEYSARELRNVAYMGPDPDGSPYTRYIAPKLATVPPLRYAVAASAACHLGARAGDRALELRSLSLRLRATETLGGWLRDGGGGPASGKGSEETLSVMLMLAQLDMCSGDCVEFETHLTAAATILRTDGDAFAGRDYFEQRLIWLDIIGATTSSRTPQFTLGEVIAALDRSRDVYGGQWGHDMFYCPIDIFQRLAEATILYKQQQQQQYTAGSSDNSDPETLERAQKIVGALDSDARTAPTPQAPRPGRPPQVVTIWQLAVVLYITSLFPSLSLPSSSGLSALSSNIFHQTRTLPSGGGWRGALIWPLFQASLVLDDGDEGEKQFVRGELAEMLSRTGCRSNSAAREKLEDVWTRAQQPGQRRVTSVAVGAEGRRLMLG